jgi:uncharacterized protein YjbI with pentapeptide repeats
MKTIKPDDMALSFKTNFLDDKEIFTVSAFATFTFDNKLPRLLDEGDLWEFAEANLEQDEVLDLGMPKPRGEFLVYGSCFSAKPVSGLGVHVNVGNIAKTLVVMGDRHWTKLGMSEAVPFTSMPLSYSKAFGGNGYANNPVGKGFAPNADGQLELPNLEDPKKPVTQKSDRPDPVGFTAYPLMWPERMQYMGKIDDNYIKDSWPHMPKGTNPEYFNTAPADQRLNGFFRGDEAFSIKNMHEKKPVQNSKLPALRARIFVLQKISDEEEKFKELENKAETLWLFPNHEVGALVYRGNIEVADDEYTDLDKLYAVWEDMAQPPKPVEFYFKQMMDTINPPEDMPEAEVEAMPKVEPVAAAETQAPEVPKVEVPPIPKLDPEVEKSLKELENLQAKMKNQLKQMNIANPDALIEEQMAKLTETPPPPPDLAATMKQLETQNADMMQKFNLSQDDLAKTIAKANTEPASPPPVEEALEKMRKAGIKDPEFEAKLTELDKLTKDIKAKMPKIEEAAAKEAVETKTVEEEPKVEEAVKEETKSEEEPVLSAKELSREEVVKQYKINKDLSKMDLTGLDLSGLDLKEAVFNDSILDNTNFKQAKLDKAVFNTCRMSETNFSGCSLKEVLFNQSNGQAVRFNNADMTLAIFSDSTYTNCDLSRANLKELGVNQTTFEESTFEGADAQKLTASRATFATCDLTSVNFTKASLVNSDISYSIINDTNFTELYAPELKFAGTVGSRTCFKKAMLVKSRADEETLLHQANFSNAELNDASWEGVKLPEVNLTSAIMDEGDFTSGDFKHSNLELVSAKNANFSKAEFVNSDLNRINLFQGSLRKARLSGANLAYSNLFGADVYKAKFGGTNLVGANLKRTLFAALGVNPEVI